MALTPSITTAARNAAANAVTALVTASSTLVIYSGTMPADANASLSGNTVLATLPMTTPTAFGAAAAGVSTANAITTDSAADATGTATFFRVLAGGSTAVMQGSAGVSGSTPNLVLNSADITLGAAVSVSALTYTQAGS